MRGSHQPKPPLSSDEAQVLGLGAALGDARVVEEEGQHHECRDLDRLKHRRAEPEALQQATIVIDSD